MNMLRYIFRSVVYYRRQHFALFLSMLVTAAVLTGSLVIGDSIRFSLKRMVDLRLGHTQYAINSGSRFITSATAGKLAKKLKRQVAPVLMIKGIAINAASGERANNANILGIDSSFLSTSLESFKLPAEGEAVIGKSLSVKLNLKPGDEIIARVENANLIPVNAPFAREPRPSEAIRLTVKSIANEEQMAGFNLGNDQSAVMNIFVAGHYLEKKLEIGNLVNMYLVAGDKNELPTQALADSLKSVWTVSDIGLSFSSSSGDGNIDLISNRIFIDTVVEKSIKRASLPGKEIISYLVNDISSGNRHTPYSFASAVPEEITGEAIGDNEIIVNRWTAQDLSLRPGDSVTLKYWSIGPLRDLREESKSFIVARVSENTTKNINNSLMPRFQGMSDAGKCRDWDAGVPIDFKRIRDKDEQYWNEYRGTPKVLLPFKTGLKLWKNPFGSITLIRFRANEVSENQISEAVLNNIRPSDIGINVINVRSEGKAAADNAVDFTELFMSLSFFVIVSGILLSSLIFSLHFSKRSVETSLLSGLGFSSKKLLMLRLSESSIVMLMGSAAGALTGILYNYLLIAGLNTIWNDIVRTRMLMLHVSIASIITGAVISLIVAVIPMIFITVKNLSTPVARQIRQTSGNMSKASSKQRLFRITGYIFIVLSVVIISFSVVKGIKNDPVTYLLAASLFLTGALSLVNYYLRSRTLFHTSGADTLFLLSIKNLKRNPGRSLAVIALLATGTFVIILTSSYRKTFYGYELDRKSGTGGFKLWAETTTPVPIDLNSAEGHDRLTTTSPGELANVRFLQFSSLKGDDASCLNLNQAQHPRLLGVDANIFDSLQCFSFVKLLNNIPIQHPWKGLEEKYGDMTFPAYADENVIQYSLKKKTGDTLAYMTESGKKLKLVLAGAISNSIFQGNILISDKVMREYYPSSGGSVVMLVDAPGADQNKLSDMLTASLGDYGIVVTSTSERLATFNSVENTYLSVFMALSGFGFLIGTIGLGIVLLRNIYERRRELALMTALGYKGKQIFILVFSENFILLMTGLLIGIVAATTGIFPSLISPAFKVQWSLLALITSAIFLSGVAWIYFPLRSALSGELLPALRNE